MMNLGVEGMMLIGGVTGFWAGVQTGNLWIALLAGGLAGAVLSGFHALLAISLRVNQIVSGLALVIVGGGLSALWGSSGDDPLIQSSNGVRVDPILPETLRDLPAVGPILFGHDPVVYLSWLIVAGTAYFLYRTNPGLSLRAVGEDPAAADAAGLSVTGIRYRFTLIGGFGAGVGGAYLALAVLGTWQTGMTAGAGWIAVALGDPGRPAAVAGAGGLLRVRRAAHARLHPADRRRGGALGLLEHDPLRGDVPRRGRGIGQPGAGPEGGRASQPRRAVLARGAVTAGG